MDTPSLEGLKDKSDKHLSELVQMGLILPGAGGWVRSNLLRALLAGSQLGRGPRDLTQRDTDVMVCMPA